MTPIAGPGQISAPGDYYVANDIWVSAGQLTANAGLYVTAAGVRINMNGKKIRGNGLSPNTVSYGIFGNATNNLVVFDGQVGGVTGFWCGIQSDTPWTRLQELDLSGNFNIGATLNAHSARLYYNKIDAIGGETTDPYNTGFNMAAGSYEVRGNTIRNLYKQGSGVGEGVAIILSASSSGGVCERNFIENDSEQAGTIGIFGGSGGAHTITGNVISGFKNAIQGGGTSGSPVTARHNVLRLKNGLSGSVGFSVAYGLVEENLVVNFANAISGGVPTGVGNTVYP